MRQEARIRKESSLCFVKSSLGLSVLRCQLVAPIRYPFILVVADQGGDRDHFVFGHIDVPILLQATEERLDFGWVIRIKTKRGRHRVMAQMFCANKTFCSSSRFLFLSLHVSWAAIVRRREEKG